MTRVEKKLHNLPQDIQKKIQKRQLLRSEKKFAESDALRDELLTQGYEIVDEENEIKIFIEESKASKSFLILFGSGETSTTGRKVHEYVFQQLDKKEITIGIITTPAGFEPNVEGVYKQMGDFFCEHLTNYHPKIKIIAANTKDEVNNPQIVNQLENVDYIFTGAGSPSYTLRMLEDSLLLEKIKQTVAQGASLCIASAATIAFSQYALPVYEIFKVGEDLHWKKGLNLYQELIGEDLTIIPHFNNNEGGAKFDSSYCYMGKDRFQKLRTLIPREVNIWGIDELTGVVIDLHTKKPAILGNGRLHQID